MWIQTKQKKMMPVNAEPVMYVEDPKGDKTIITREGEIVKGSLYGPIDDLEIGYISHFATCPNADQHRRNR